MKLAPVALAKKIAAAEFSPAYYFYGDDDYRITEAVRFMISHFLPEAQRVSNVSRADLNEKKFDELRMELAEPPFFGERKVLIVYEIQKLSAKQLDDVISALAAPFPERLVILTTRAAKKPRWDSTFMKRMQVVMPTVEFKRHTDTESIKRAAQLFGMSNIQADTDALQTLAEMVDGDAGRLSNEVEKIVTYLGPGGTLTKDLVQRVCAAATHRVVFDLVDAVVARNTAEALKLLDTLMLAGESETGIMFWIGRQFEELYYVKGGRTPRVFPSKLAQLKSQARNIATADIERAMSLVYECESALKGGRTLSSYVSKRDALEALILRLCDVWQAPVEEMA